LRLVARSIGCPSNFHMWMASSFVAGFGAWVVESPTSCRLIRGTFDCAGDEVVHDAAAEGGADDDTAPPYGGGVVAAAGGEGASGLLERAALAAGAAVRGAPPCKLKKFGSATMGGGCPP